MRVVALIVLVPLLGGCGIGFGGDDEPDPEPKAETTPTKEATTQPTPVEVKAESLADVCDNIDGKQEAVPQGTKSVPLIDGSGLYCLDEQAAAAYRNELRDRATALLEPLSRSFMAGGAPQVILRDLTQLGCQQPATNFYFWEAANRLYSGVASSPASMFTRDWPSSYSAAIAEDCF